MNSSHRVQSLCSTCVAYMGGWWLTWRGGGGEGGGGGGEGGGGGGGEGEGKGKESIYIETLAM